jgi:sec-independent protein translocase protein TatB
LFAPDPSVFSAGYDKMLFDIGWPELMLIGVVALVVIGPKDLPAALRVAGFWVRKARSLSREFQSSVEQMMREAELHEVQQDLKKATEFDLDREFQKIVDPAIDPGADPALAAKKAEAPDHVDMTPAPVDPLLPPPEEATEAASLEVMPTTAPEPEPAIMPETPTEADTPARAAEPSKS